MPGYGSIVSPPFGIQDPREGGAYGRGCIPGTNFRTGRANKGNVHAARKNACVTDLRTSSNPLSPRIQEIAEELRPTLLRIGRHLRRETEELGVTSQ